MLARRKSFNVNGHLSNQIDKLGNTLIFLADEIPSLYKTKVLKLIYILDELSIKRFGIPFIGLDYLVWERGPVNELLYDELTNGPKFLMDFISVIPVGNDMVRISANRQFDDSEFSQNDISLLLEVIRDYGSYQSNQLVTLLHEPDALWTIIAKETGALDDFESKKLTTTNFEIDFSRILNDEYLKMRYEDYQDNVKVSKTLKK